MTRVNGFPFFVVLQLFPLMDKVECTLSENDLRVAVVGLGKMGLLHASILSVMPNVQLAGVCETNSFTRRMFKKILRDVPFFTDVGELSGLDIDAIFITTPISSHFPVAKKVYEKHLSRHLFIEKPLTSSYDESKKLCDLASSNGGVNMVGYLRRFMVTFMKAKELLSEGHIGEPVSFHINAFSSDFFGVREDAKISGARGGVLRDLGSYAIDIALWFFGGIQLRSAESQSLTSECAEDSVLFSVCQETDPLQGTVSASWCKEGYRMPEVVLSIEGSKGSIEVDDDKVSLSLNGGSESAWFRHNLNDNVKFWLGAPEYYREDEYFIESARNNFVPEPSFKTASNVDLLIDLIKQKVKKD